MKMWTVNNVSNVQNQIDVCEVRISGTQTKRSYAYLTKRTRAKSILEITHIDVCGIIHSDKYFINVHRRFFKPLAACPKRNVRSLQGIYGDGHCKVIYSSKIINVISF